MHPWLGTCCPPRAWSARGSASDAGEMDDDDMAGDDSAMPEGEDSGLMVSQLGGTVGQGLPLAAVLCKMRKGAARRSSNKYWTA